MGLELQVGGNRDGEVLQVGVLAAEARGAGPEGFSFSIRFLMI